MSKEQQKKPAQSEPEKPVDDVEAGPTPRYASKQWGKYVIGPSGRRRTAEAT
jgi:hypothetical protein